MTRYAIEIGKMTIKTRQLVISSVQMLSCVQLFVTLWTAALQASLSITKSWSLLKIMFIESGLPFHTVHGFLKARILKWFALPFSRGQVLSELSTMTHPSWVALHSMAHSFISCMISKFMFVLGKTLLFV